MSYDQVPFNESLVIGFVKNSPEVFPEYVISPTRSAPMRVKNCAIVHFLRFQQFGVEFLMLALADGLLVVCLTEERNGEAFTKARALRHLGDVWSITPKAEGDELYREFLDHCGQKLGDPNFFWIPVSKEVLLQRVL